MWHDRKACRQLMLSIVHVVMFAAFRHATVKTSVSGDLSGWEEFRLETCGKIKWWKMLLWAPLLNHQNTVFKEYQHIIYIYISVGRG